MSEEKPEIGLTVKKSEDFSEWYNQVVLESGLAEYAPISGCMVIKPYGYAIWEKIQQWFDQKLKSSGVANAYFPMFIPEKFLKKEAEHFEGFVPEVAWVEKSEETEERYALRPTSETIMYSAYSKWIRSWRDLPLRINQWCNIVRWEVKATRLFLRTREFLWQEGHTAHSTLGEAEEEARLRAEQYKELFETQLAIPVIMGKKSKKETFAGALYTIALEALMPDGKGLQMGTSHNLGQNFSKPFDIKFRDKDGEEKYVWQTSWGATTRLIGAIAMVHGDDKGLVIPPEVAPVQVVIIPIYENKTKSMVLKEARKLEKRLSGKFSVKLDDRDGYSPGWKFNEWELKGIPLRLEIGPRDIKNKQVVLVRRDTGEKMNVKQKNIVNSIRGSLESIQKGLYRRAEKFLKENTKTAGNFQELKKLIESRKIVSTYWCKDARCEEETKEKTGATIRCIKTENAKPGRCVLCGKKSEAVVYFARAY